jgi:hypothetical protein
VIFIDSKTKFSGANLVAGSKSLNRGNRMDRFDYDKISDSCDNTDKLNTEITNLKTVFDVL